MDSIKYLLHFLFKLVVGIFFAVIVWWLITLFAPQFNPKSLFTLAKNSSIASSTTLGDSWLPSPKNRIDTTNKVAQTTLFNGYGGDQSNSGQFDYLKYQEAGEEMAKGTAGRPTTADQRRALAVSSATSTITAAQLTTVYSQKNMFLRNLSIYEGWHVYTGLSFTAEARENMFLNGKFPVVILDPSNGQVVSVAYAEAITNWTVPGWVKFQVKMTGALPSRRPCVMIFEQARYKNSKAQPIRVVMPITCN